MLFVSGANIIAPLTRTASPNPRRFRALGADLVAGKAQAPALSAHGVLTSLNISSNEIGNEGAKAIGDALQVNSVLTEVRAFLNLGRVLGLACFSLSPPLHARAG